MSRKLISNNIITENLFKKWQKKWKFQLIIIFVFEINYMIFFTTHDFFSEFSYVSKIKNLIFKLDQWSRILDVFVAIFNITLKKFRDDWTTSYVGINIFKKIKNPSEIKNENVKTLRKFWNTFTCISQNQQIHSTWKKRFLDYSMNNFFPISLYIYIYIYIFFNHFYTKSLFLAFYI